MNAWLAQVPQDRWMGEGTLDSPVNLALTVTPMADESADAQLTSYKWSLTNLGSEKCHFLALLLTFGDAPDFKGENLVMVLDGSELKPGADNSVSGSFAVNVDWGEGPMHFAALAVSEKDGSNWLSNSVEG